MDALSTGADRWLNMEVMLDPAKIARRVAELGREISRDYAGKAPIVVGVLKGGVVFLSDLIRHIDLPLEVEFVSAGSYRGTKQDADVDVSEAKTFDVHGRDLLVVEGIVDSGRTAQTILEHFRSEEPASVEFVTLIDKPASRRVKVDLKYVGFKIGNEFVVGYGLDNTQKYRNLPYIGRVSEG